MSKGIKWKILIKNLIFVKSVIEQQVPVSGAVLGHMALISSGGWACLSMIISEHTGLQEYISSGPIPG